MSRLKKEDIRYEEQVIKGGRTMAVISINADLCGSYTYRIHENYTNEDYEIENEKTFFLSTFEPKLKKDIRGSGTMTMQHIIDDAEEKKCKYVASCVLPRVEAFIRKFEYKGKKFIEITDGEYRYDI